MLLAVFSGKAQLQINFLKEGEALPAVDGPGQLDETEHLLSGGFKVVPLDSGWILQAANGKRLTDRTYATIGQFRKGRAACQFGDRWGFLNAAGREIIPVIYKAVVPFDNATATAKVYDGTRWIEIGLNGEVKRLLPANYQPNPQSAKSFQQLKKNYDDYRIVAPPVNNLFPCPPNIGFENGNFANWICYVGDTYDNGINNIISVSPSPATWGRHTIINSSGATDYYGGFPLAAPDGSSRFVQLGNTINGAEAEAIRYSISVPSGATNYSITYNYAVVFENPVGHDPWEQPRFIARIFDPLTNSAVNCSQFVYVSDASIPGFSTSPNLSQYGEEVRYKPWSSAYINLGAYAGRTIYLEFVTADCTLTGHWGYAYVDVNEVCDLAAKALYQCAPPNLTTLIGPPGFQSYTWWNQNYTTQVGNTNPFVLNPGPPLGTQYNLVMVPFTGFGCRDTVTVTVTSQFPTASFTPPAEQCLRNNSFTFTSTSTTSNGTTFSDFEWDYGDNTPRGHGLTVTHSYLTPGVYDVMLIVTNSATCKDTVRHTIRVKESPTAAFATPAEQCLRNNIFSFTSSSTMTNGTLTGLSWDFGGDGTGVGSPVSHSFSTAGSFNVRLTATASNGCTDVATHPVRVNPQPVAAFTSPAGQCLGGNSFTFTSTSTISGGTLGTANWNFGDNTTGTGSPATHVYTAADDYSVKLEIASDKGCIDSIRRTVSVWADPIVNVTSVRPLTFCDRDSVILTANAQAGSGIIVTYQWYRNGTAIPGETGTQLIVKTSGSYTITVSNSNGCSKTSAATAVTVYPLPVGNLQLPSVDFICDGSPVQLTANGGATYQWYLDGNPIPGASGPTYPALLPGLYEVELISAQGCRNRASGNIRLKLYKKPIPDFSFPTSCARRQILFDNLSDTLSSGDVTWLWSFGDGSTSTQFEPTHTYVYGLNYSISLTATPLKCPNLVESIKKIIRIENPRSPIRYPAVNALINVDKQLAARNFGIKYEWTPRTGLNNHLIRNPIFKYLLQTDYTIRIETTAGCITVDSQLVRVFKNIDIFVPKAFSPNGDGHNDKLDVFLVGIGELRYFRVFNRWGQLLFETHDPAQLWDGTYQGVKQPLETYVWTAEGVGEDGSVVVRRGQTVLLR